MINFRFSIENPCVDRFETVWWKAGKTFFKHKFWEFQIMRTTDVIAWDIRYTVRQDHAGLDVWLGLFSYSLNLKIYDNRHWNYEKGCWEVYEEDLL